MKFQDAINSQQMKMPLIPLLSGRSPVRSAAGWPAWWSPKYKHTAAEAAADTETSLTRLLPLAAKLTKLYWMFPHISIPDII